MLLNREALIAIRKAGGDTQETLAERTGISEVSINAIERGRARPRHSTIRRLADALSVPVGAITIPDPQETGMGGEGSGRPPKDEDKKLLAELREALPKVDREAEEASKAKAKALFARKQAEVKAAKQAKAEAVAKKKAEADKKAAKKNGGK